MKRLVPVGLLLALCLFAQSPTVINRNAQWPPQSGPAYSFGGPFEIYYQAVPTSLTAVSTHDAHLLGYCVYNSTAGSLTFTIQTKDASPLPLPLTGAISAGQYACNDTPFGLLAKGGFSVQASGSGMYYQAVWTN